MRQITPAEYRERFFSPESRPTIRTVRRWCDRGLLPAKRIGANWYIDVDRLDSDETDPLVKKILTQ